MKLSWYFILFYASLVLAQGLVPVPDQPLTPQPKIFFLGTLGGISHTAWVIEILDLVRTRGYNVSYVSFKANQKYIKNHPEIGFIPLPDLKTSVQFRDFFDPEEWFSQKVQQSMWTYFKETLADQLVNAVSIMKTEKPDLMVCDHTAVACMDAAHHLNITVVLTSTVKIRAEPPDNFVDLNTLDSDVDGQGFKTRLISSYQYIKFRLHMIKSVIPVYLDMESIRRKLKMSRFDYIQNNSGAVKLINQMFPLENPHSLDANEHYIGPIFISQSQPLNDKLATYLDSHKKVVYIAFGQMYTPTQIEFNTLVQALLTNYRQGIIDGFIWATVGLPKTMLEHFQSNRTINSDGFANNPDFLFEQWIPQYAVLNHTSTKLFISHAGTASTHEAIFNGVPILAHPFSSDQPANALQLEKAGVALVNNRKTCTVESIARKIKIILKDQYSEFVHKANELRELAYISSRRKAIAADIIEQLVLCSRNGKAWYYLQDEQKFHLFMPSWGKLVLVYVTITTGIFGIRTFRKQMSKLAYQKVTQRREIVYQKFKKLQ